MSSAVRSSQAHPVRLFDPIANFLKEETGAEPTRARDWARAIRHGGDDEGKAIAELLLEFRRANPRPTGKLDPLIRLASRVTDSPYLDTLTREHIAWGINRVLSVELMNSEQIAKNYDVLVQPPLQIVGRTPAALPMAAIRPAQAGSDPLQEIVDSIRIGQTLPSPEQRDQFVHRFLETLGVKPK